MIKFAARFLALCAALMMVLLIGSIIEDKMSIPVAVGIGCGCMAYLLTTKGAWR